MSNLTPELMPNNKKTLLISGVFFIKELDCEFVVEDRLSLLKRNLVFLEIDRGLRGIPFKLEHQYIVWK